MTPQQQVALSDLCSRYGVTFNDNDYHPQFDLPTGYVAGWVGPIYVGCSPEGEISS